MTRYVCIHGHFYQPPRENPWLEDVELQDEAYPYHDWNDKITEECYRQNAASRILGAEKKIIDIVNNYSKMSFDFGPTLLSWLERHVPDVYRSIIEADKESQAIFSGHGAAIAQAYNHIIMPLANRRDKYTQVVWGIRDFEYRFGRRPEGMWLPETAVDSDTLEILADCGIKFTVLAPHQARRVRKIGDRHWKDIDKDNIDTTKPYLCRLGSGRTISLFFYHGATANNAAEGRILKNGELFAENLLDILTDEQKEAQLAHIACDGETYGHHHRHSDMALAYCLGYIESNELAKITVYSEYLEKFPPAYEVEINENTSWSCSHGVERWRGNCGCHYGKYPSGAQQWRGPLREAMDWLRDELAEAYQGKMSQYVSEPWELRNEYICVIHDRADKNVENFLRRFVGEQLCYDEKVAVLKLLEMQRNALLMHTSCGWFFDDLCGTEGLQIMQYAARAMQLAKEVDGNDLESGFKNILEKAEVNVKEFANGKEAYESLVQPNSIDLNRVGAHFAISSIFEEYPDKTDIYCYSADTEAYDRLDAGGQILATGRTTLQSNVTLERHSVDFAVLHLDAQNLICAVNLRMPDEAFSTMQEDVKIAFVKGDAAEVMRLMNTTFGKNSYSLWHLFKDEQRRILYELLETTWQEIEASFRHIYEHNYSIMRVMRGMNMPLPKALSTPAEFIVNQDISRALQDDRNGPDRLNVLVEQATRLSLQLDQATLRFEANRKINRLMNRFADCPGEVKLLETIDATVRILLTIISEPALQTAQNIFFSISRGNYTEMRQKADSGEAAAKKWIKHFESLGDQLDVKIR